MNKKLNNLNRDKRNILNNNSGTMLESSYPRLIYKWIKQRINETGVEESFFLSHFFLSIGISKSLVIHIFVLPCFNTFLITSQDKFFFSSSVNCNSVHPQTQCSMGSWISVPVHMYIWESLSRVLFKSLTKCTDCGSVHLISLWISKPSTPASISSSLEGWRFRACQICHCVQ